jgi:phosphatidylglycerol:prolipoprotein diacylglycerol transferase
VLPFSFRLGPLAINPVELFALLGVAVAGVLVRQSIEPKPSWGGMIDLGIAAVLGGAVGARLFHFVPLWLRGQETTVRLVTTWSEGSGFFGGLAGGTALVLVVARAKKLSLLNVADAVGLNMPIGFAIGKIGCFLEGCCYGRRCDSFPGVAFRPGSLAYEAQQGARILPPGAPASLPVHPTQLYEFFFALCLFAFLRWFRPRFARPGQTFLAYVLGYSLWRFLIEFFRDDPGRHNFGSSAFTDSQIVAILFVVVCGALWRTLERRPKSVGEEAQTPK